MQLKSFFLLSVFLVLSIATALSSILAPVHATESSDAPGTGQAIDYLLPDRLSKAITVGDEAYAVQLMDDVAPEVSESVDFLLQSARFHLYYSVQPTESVLNYSLTSEAESQIRQLIRKVMRSDARNIVAISILAEMHTIQGRVKEARNTLVRIPEEQRSISPLVQYNYALINATEGRDKEALEILQPVISNDDNAKKNRVWEYYRRGWTLAKAVMTRSPELDKYALIREGLMERVEESDVLAQIAKRSASDLPLMLIVSSEDDKCGPCINTPEKIEKFVRRNRNKYQFIFTSVEPWYHNSYSRWFHAIPKMKGVPGTAVYARSLYMFSGAIPLDDVQSDYYDKMYPRVLSESPGTESFVQRENYADYHVSYSLWNEQKWSGSAFAYAGSKAGRAYGAVYGGVDQSSANRQAMAMCGAMAAERKVDERCELNVDKE